MRKSCEITLSHVCIGRMWSHNTILWDTTFSIIVNGRWSCSCYALEYGVRVFHSILKCNIHVIIDKKKFNVYVNLYRDYPKTKTCIETWALGPLSLFYLSHILVLHSYCFYKRHFCIFYSMSNTIYSFSISNDLYQIYVYLRLDYKLNFIFLILMYSFLKLHIFYYYTFFHFFKVQIYFSTLSIKKLNNVFPNTHE